MFVGDGVPSKSVPTKRDSLTDFKEDLDKAEEMYPRKGELAALFARFSSKKTKYILHYIYSLVLFE